MEQDRRTSLERQQIEALTRGVKELQGIKERLQHQPSFDGSQRLDSDRFGASSVGSRMSSPAPGAFPSSDRPSGMGLGYQQSPLASSPRMRYQVSVVPRSTCSVALYSVVVIGRHRLCDPVA